MSEAERMCVACGKQVPAEHDRAKPWPDCNSPDACTFDMTTDEAWQYWRRLYHDQREAHAIAIREAVEAARVDERERCARIADKLEREAWEVSDAALNCSHEEADEAEAYRLHHIWQGTRIVAAAIRTPTEQGKGRVMDDDEWELFTSPDAGDGQ